MVRVFFVDESILAIPVVIGWKPVQKEELVKNAVFLLLAGMRSESFFLMIRNWSQELAEIEIVFNGMYSK